MVDTEFDIVVVGGGLVGSSLVRALIGTPFRIAVVESTAQAVDAQPGYDDRVFAIAYGSKVILDTMGVWGELASADRIPIKTVHISDRGNLGSVCLTHEKHGVKALGYGVTARQLGNVLVNGVARQSSVAVLRPARAESLETGDSHASITVEEEGGPRNLRARLVVFADGADSGMRESLDFETERRGYEQSAIVTTVTPGRHRPHTAYERFTESGPLALLPNNEDRFTVVWTAWNHQVETLLHCSDEELLSKLQYRFGDRLGRLHRLGRRRSYPLSFVNVRKPIRHRVAVLGNAAHTVHPVAGQGFNLGLRDVSTMADVLVRAQDEGKDIGGLDVLNEYWRWRRDDTQRVGQFTDGLIRVFANDSLPLKMARGLGLFAMDISPQLQGLLVKRTMGLAGRLPRLSRGLTLSQIDAQD